MKITQLQPTPNCRVSFRRSEHQKVSTAPGCYVLTTFQDDILYIGQADRTDKCLNQRFLEHLDNPEKTLPTAEGKAIWFYFLEYESNRIGVLENTWLQTFETTEGHLPILNKIRSPG